MKKRANILKHVALVVWKSSLFITPDLSLMAVM